MASMKDVAEIAGVSVSTVSRVLSGKIPVDEKTQKKVRQVIKELDYRPNLIASGLRSKSGKVIGVLVPRIVDPFFTYLIDYLDRAIIDQDYNLLLFNTYRDPNFEEKIIDNLVRRHVDGIIYSMVSDESWAMELLEGVEVPVVMLDRIANSDKFMNLALDNKKAGFLAAEHFISLGHTNIVCLTGPQKVRLSRDRSDGFLEALEKNGINCKSGSTGEYCMVEGDFTFQCGLRFAEQLVKQNERPTAVWAQNDLMAAGVLKGLIKTGINVPEEMSILGMDNAEIPEMVHPSLSTIAQPIKEMAETAVDMLINRQIYEIRGQRMLLLDPTLVVRESTGRPSEGGGKK